MRRGLGCLAAAAVGLAAVGAAAAPAKPAPASAACPTDAMAPAATPEVVLDTRPSGSGAARYGRLQYAAATPLKPMQIALTFDDGPSAANNQKVLDILDRHCIKAAFFLVGWFAEARPDLVRAVAARGHTIGTHSWLHPTSLKRLDQARAEREIAQGFTGVQAALADAPPQQRARLAPFFRFPGLNDSPALIRWLGDKQVAVVSADFGSDDWKKISAAEIQRRALKYAAETKGGILILHETRPHTVEALEPLILELERRGYSFVQLVSAPEARSRAIQAPGALITAGRVAPVSLAELKDLRPPSTPERVQLAQGGPAR